MDNGETFPNRNQIIKYAVSFITEERSSKLYLATISENPEVSYSYKANNKKVVDTLKLDEFIDVKGYKALGNKLGEFKILKIEERVSEKPAQKTKKRRTRISIREIQLNSIFKISEALETAYCHIRILLSTTASSAVDQSRMNVVSIHVVER